ncbi:alkaline-phosphatase-like protein [Morchella snyderi]|nr:alkaline-phosphatase-like protein [Morchella snyderi]
MARDWMHWNNNATVDLPIDRMMIGQVRTRSSDSYVPDSASTATAYSCGIKVYNGAIGIDDDVEPCGTVLEAAKAQGYKTGLIATSRITHATPASYVAHVYDRDIESNIALQEIGVGHPLGSVVDVIMGGGRCFFTPQNTTDSCRDDDIDALELARQRGYTVFGDRAAFEEDVKLPYLGLFTQDHMSYEIDRDPAVEPSLTEMALKGINDLYKATKKSKKGFFIMVEASRIDHAGHANDATGHLHDILEYNRAMDAMREWIDEHDDSETVLISTADHECGGLTLGYELDGAPDYWFAPEHFASSHGSSGKYATLWKNYKSNDTSDATQYLKKSVYAPYGIMDPSEEEITQGLALKSSTSNFGRFIALAFSKRLKVHWATGGHTGVDVTLYGHGLNHEKLAGQRENTEIAHFVAEQLGLDLEPVTEKLRADRDFVEKLVKKQPGDAARLKGRDLTHYHH